MGIGVGFKVVGRRVGSGEGCVVGRMASVGGVVGEVGEFVGP